MAQELLATPSSGVGAIMTFQGFRRNPFATNALWTFLGNVIYAGCQWGMLSALAKTMPEEAVGRFAIAFAVSAPVIILSQLQLRAVQATDTEGVHALREYMTLRCVMSVLALAVIGAICVGSHFDRATLEVVGLISVAKTVESVSDVLYGVFQQREEMAFMGRSLIFKGLLSLTGFGLLIVFTHNLNLACLGLLVAWTSVLLVYDIRRAKRLSGNMLRNSAGRLSVAGCGVLFKATLPLGIASYLYTLTPNLPRYIIDSHSGRSQLGVYAALTYVVIAGTAVVNAIGTASTPRLAQAFATRQAKRFWRFTLALFGVATTVGLVMLVPVAALGPGLLTFLYGARYAQYQTLFLWIIGTGAVGYGASILGYAVLATRRFNIQVPIHASVAATTFLMCWLLIPRFGTVGAVWGLLTGSIVSIAMSFIVLHNGVHRFGSEAAGEAQ